MVDMVTLESIKLFFMALVEKYGLLGIFIIGFTEPIFQPFPVEMFMIAGISLGMDWISVLLVGGIGSILGSIVTYFLAIKYGEQLAFKFFSEKDYRKGEDFLKKYGLLGFIAISFTPIPFEIMCWVCGVFEMPFERYLLGVFVSRVIKHGVIIIPFVWGINLKIW